MAEGKARVTEEQVLYGKILNIGMKAGLLGLFVTCGIYMSGILSPVIPVGELPKYWTMPVHDFLGATGLHAGWAWMHNIGTGDYINYIPVAFLAGITIVCYVAIVPTLLRKKDTVYAVLAILEAVVLVAAASGILGSGGH